MSSFRFEQDPKLPAVTIYTPSGRRIRLTEYPNGELRANFPGPVAMTSAVLDTDPVKISLMPYAADLATKHGGAVAETIMNTRRLVNASRDVLSSATGIPYQLGIVRSSERTPDERAQACKVIQGQIETIMVAFETMSFLGTLRNQLGHIAYDLKRLGQFEPIKASFSSVIATWAGDNHAKTPIPALFAQISEEIAKAGILDLLNRWQSPRARQPDTYAEIVETNRALLRHENR